MDTPPPEGYLHIGFRDGEEVRVSFSLASLTPARTMGCWHIPVCPSLTKCWGSHRLRLV